MKIYGTADGETIEGTTGGERIFAGGGNDIIHGNGGPDWLYGEDGDDFIDLTSKTTLASGGDGDDVLKVIEAFGSVTHKLIQVDGGTGRDTFDASSVSMFDPTDSITWSARAGGGFGFGDIVVDDVEVIKGLASRNFFLLADVDHALVVYGGAEKDVFFHGTGFADTMRGLGGDDQIYLDADDRGFGGDGDDTIVFNTRSNGWADGGGGIDTVTGDSSVDLAAGYFFTSPTDTFNVFTNFENATITQGAAYGTEDANLLQSSGAGSSLYGRGGDDILQTGSGIDFLDGGAGTDIASYNYYHAGRITARLAEHGDTTIRLNNVANDVLHDIEGIAGSDDKDILKGNSADNIFYGNDGNDVLFGGDGNDVLDGGPGRNQLTGGAGADIFQASATFAGGTILDFNRAEGDRIDVSKIDADPYTPGDQAFTLVFGLDLAHSAGNLYVFASQGTTYVTGYDSGQRVVAFTLPGTTDIQPSDFVL